MPSLLQVEDLHVSFEKSGAVTQAVRGVDFAVERNETLCIVGESGSGKSVTAKSILRLLPADVTRYQGRIRFEGEDLLALRSAELRRIAGSRITMIFQDPLTSLNPVYRIGQQMISLIRLHDRSMDREAAYAKAKGLLESVEINRVESVLENYPFELSGGMRQRVMIAMAISTDPSLLLADEPTTALDVTVQAQILKLLAQIQRDNHLSIVFITHDLAVAHEIADRIAVFHDGRIVEQGAADRIFYEPQQAYTKKLLNSVLRV